MKKYKPTKNNVFIEVELIEKIGDIHIPEESRKASMKGTITGLVLAVGPEVKDIKPGERAMFFKHLFTSYDAQKFKREGEGERWGLVLRGEDILALIEKE